MTSPRFSLATKLSLLNVALLVATFAITWIYGGNLPRPLDIVVIVAAAILGFPFGLCLVVLPVSRGPSSVVTTVVVALTLSVNAFIWGQIVAAIWGGLSGGWHSPAARRRAAGLCPNCGYDIRATPERCPECGHGTGSE